MDKARGLAAVLAGLTALVSQGLPAGAYPRPGSTERVSIAHDGAEVNAQATFPSLSDDGRFVAMDSSASNLVPDDTNGAADIFVTDRLTGRVERVSVGSDGTEADGPSYIGRISGNGRFVMFHTGASNIFDDQNPEGDVLLHDRATGELEVVDVATDGRQANTLTFPGDISPDGRYVTFETWATNLGATDTNERVDVYLRDRVTGVTERVSVNDDESQRTGDSSSSSVSEDGRFVAFVAITSHTGNDADGVGDHIQVFLRDRQAGRTTLVSRALDGGAGNSFSSNPIVSPDGRYVTFGSASSNLVPNDTNRQFDAYVRDMATGVTERVSVSSAGVEGNAGSGSALMTPDGRFVAFTSKASNFVAGDTNACAPPNPFIDPPGCTDVFVHDRVTGVTERVSVASDGSQGTRNSRYTSLSDDGRIAAFSSYSTNLVSGDTNDQEDVFVRDRGPALGVGGATAQASGGGVAVSGWAAFSGTEAARASDAPSDAGPAALEAGAELTGVAITYRHEDESLLVRLPVAKLPGVQTPAAPGSALMCPFIWGCLPGTAGAPGVVYGAAFQVGTSRFEARAIRGGTSAAASGAVAALYRCETVCTEAAALTGGVGTTGNEVRISVPLSAIGAKPGDTLTAVSGFAGPGVTLSGAGTRADEAALPNVRLPEPRVELGVSSAGGVAVEASATPAGASFGGSLSHIPSDRRVWGRACLADTCGDWHSTAIA